MGMRKYGNVSAQMNEVQFMRGNIIFILEAKEMF